MDKSPRMAWIERGWFVVAVVLPLAVAVVAAFAPATFDPAPVVIAYVALAAIVMPWSGWLYLGEALRESPAPAPGASQAVRIDVRDWAGGRLRTLRLGERIAPAVAAAHALIVVLMLRGQAPAWIGIAAVVVSVLVARGIGPLLLGGERQVLERAVAKGASLIVGSEGLWLPVCLCTEPTRRLAHARGLTEIELPWSAVLRVEVRDGPRGGHWLIEVAGEACSLACTSRATFGLKNPFIGLHRVWGEGEDDALAAIRATLPADRLVIRAMATGAP